MRVDIITALPELLESPLNHSIIKRAREKKAVEIYIHNLRDYAVNKYKSIDDYAFGGDAGMVMMIEPIDKAISALKKERTYDEIIYTSPDGENIRRKKPINWQRSKILSFYVAIIKESINGYAII